VKEVASYTNELLVDVLSSPSELHPTATSPSPGSSRRASMPGWGAYRSMITLVTSLFGVGTPHGQPRPCATSSVVCHLAPMPRLHLERTESGIMLTSSDLAQ
jgi:hypothetical protein